MAREALFWIETLAGLLGEDAGEHLKRLVECAEVAEGERKKELFYMIDRAMHMSQSLFNRSGEGGGLF